MNSERVLILGASGMLGSMLFKCFHEYSDHAVLGVVRSRASIKNFSSSQAGRLEVIDDILDPRTAGSLIRGYKPTTLINCIGLVKQLDESLNPLLALPVNSIFPHQLDEICASLECKLIHFSTDCVFSGNTGGYDEDSIADSRDIYGLSKYLGELTSSPNAITLRTSIIGHELCRHTSLLDWFLRSEVCVNGFRNAVFSGLTTREVFNVIINYVLPKTSLSGVYHLASTPISKFDLLLAIKAEYGKAIEVVPVDIPVINRSLVSERFQVATGYIQKPWSEQLQQLHESSIELGGYGVCV
jgi:dTDP-4-dehydrorhamnose reductase